MRTDHILFLILGIVALVSLGWAVYFLFPKRNLLLSALSIGNIALCVCMTNMGPLAVVCLLPLVVCMVVAARTARAEATAPPQGT